jgi:hypothetical protein
MFCARERLSRRIGRLLGLRLTPVAAARTAATAASRSVAGSLPPVACDLPLDDGEGVTPRERRGRGLGCRCHGTAFVSRN